MDMEAMSLFAQDCAIALRRLHIWHKDVVVDVTEDRVQFELNRMKTEMQKV
jgi:hypothetical protein